MRLTRIGAKTKKEIDTTEFFQEKAAEVQFSLNIIKLHVKDVKDEKGNSQDNKPSENSLSRFDNNDSTKKFIKY